MSMYESVSVRPFLHFFVLWYWIDVSSEMVKMLISKEIVDGNYLFFLLCSWWSHINILLDCWNFINVDVNGRELVLTSSIETIDIHMVSDQSQRNARYPVRLEAGAFSAAPIPSSTSADREWTHLTFVSILSLLVRGISRGAGSRH